MQHHKWQNGAGAIGDIRASDFSSQEFHDVSGQPGTSYYSSSQTFHPPFILPQQYISMSVIHVYIGAMLVNSTYERIPMVARVSLADYRGNTLLDTYVRPTHPIQDYRISETGLQFIHLANAPLFSAVQHSVAELIRNKVIVGHRLWNALSILGLSHPAIDTRDLALFRPLRKKLKSRTIVPLPTLVHIFMGREVTLDYEDSLEFARAQMDLFRSCEQLFESMISTGAWPCDLPPTAYVEYYS